MPAVTVVGLDIGSTAIRAVETQRGKAGSTIKAFGQAELPAGAVKAGVVQDDRAVTATIKQLWASSSLRCRNVVLSVTNRQIVVREMSVTNVPAKELRRSLPYQVRHLLPLAVEESVLDFHPLEDPGQNKNVRGLLIAAPKEPILAAVQASERAGLRVQRVDLASFALLRALARLDDQVEAIVDIGAQVMTVVVHFSGEPLIVRTVPRGGAEITEMIANRLSVPAEQAEARKRQTGLVNATDPPVAEVVWDAIRPLINEIRSSFAYLTNGDQPRSVARLVLSGGGALLPGLASALSTQLDIDVVVADPAVRLRGGHRAATGNSASTSNASTSNASTGAGSASSAGVGNGIGNSASNGTGAEAGSPIGPEAGVCVGLTLGAGA